MNPYGVAQPYAETPSKDWVLTEPASYVEPVPYVFSEPADEPVVLTEVQAQPYITAEPYGQGAPYVASEVVAYSNGNAEGNLAFVQEARGGAVGALTHVTYGVEIPYVNPYPYVGLPEVEITYKAENFLTFDQTADTETKLTTNALSFEQVAYAYPLAGDNLTFVQEVTGGAEHFGEDVLAFMQVASFAYGGEDALAFTQVASGGTEHITDQYLAILQEVTWEYKTEDAENALVFGTSAEIRHLIVQDLTLVQEHLGVAATGSAGILAFEQVATWTRASLRGADQALKFLQYATYLVSSGGSGGSGFIPTTPPEPPPDHVTVGPYTLRVSDDYELEHLFSNGRYLNLGYKYTVPVGRPLAIQIDWQEVVKALVGTVCTVTHLVPKAFDVFITDETRLTSEGMDLTFYALEHDTRGEI